MPKTKNDLSRIIPAIVAALSDERGPDRPIKVAFAPHGHIEAIITLCDDGPVVSIENEPTGTDNLTLGSKGVTREDDIPF
jgi:hypothetical protein